MTGTIATRQDAEEIARQLRDELPKLALQEKAILISEGTNPKGRLEWTRAVWQFFVNFASTRDWKVYPAKKPKRGKGAGEYLVDFAVFDDNLGFRIACESDWGGTRDVSWAFDKLRGVKADVKILLFEATHHEAGIPERFRSVFEEFLRLSHHHSPGREFYVFAQFQGESARLFLWEPPSFGPFPTEEIKFDRID